MYLSENIVCSLVRKIYLQNKDTTILNGNAVDLNSGADVYSKLTDSHINIEELASIEHYKLKKKLERFGTQHGDISKQIILQSQAQSKNMAIKLKKIWKGKILHI